MVDRVSFVLNGEQMEVSRDDVDRAVLSVRGDMRTWGVCVANSWYPLNETFRLATGAEKFTTYRARDILRRLGFQVSTAIGRRNVSNKPKVSYDTRLKAIDVALDIARIAAPSVTSVETLLRNADYIANWLGDAAEISEVDAEAA